MAEVNGEISGRATNGKFVPGNRCSVGNSGGSARKSARDVLNGHGPKALRFLAAVAENDRDHLPPGFKNDPELMLKAAVKVAEWVYGKPVPLINVETPTGTRTFEVKLSLEEVGEPEANGDTDP